MKTCLVTRTPENEFAVRMVPLHFAAGRLADQPSVCDTAGMREFNPALDGEWKNLFLPERGRDPLRSHWETREPHSNSIVDRIRNDGSHHDDRGFSSPLGRRFAVVDENRLDLRQPGKPGDLIGIEIAVEDHTILESNAFRECIP